MSKMKGGAEATCQNFSMHPDLMEAIVNTANAMNQQRASQIVGDRDKRVTYSKVASTLAWLLKTRYLDEQQQPNEAWHELLQQYEASDYEKPDDKPRKRKKRLQNSD